MTPIQEDRKKMTGQAEEGETSVAEEGEDSSTGAHFSSHKATVSSQEVMVEPLRALFISNVKRWDILQIFALH